MSRAPIPRFFAQMILSLALLSFILSSCSMFNDLTDAEKAALDYAMALYSDKQNPETLSMLTGRKVTKEGIAHIKPFLKSQGTVRIGSVSSGKDRVNVYIHFSQDMTSGPSLKGFTFKKAGKHWYFQGELKVPDLKGTSFDEFERSSEYKNIKVEDWKEIDLEK